MEDEIEKLKEICQQNKVVKLYLFGSYGTEKFNIDSDIDLLIKFEDDMNAEDYTDNYFALQYKLRKLFNRNIDLITENSLSNPYFIKEIERTKRLIYAN